MKRVLFIAYAFPPCGGAGVQRSAKFVRYLPEYGWLPTVLTVAPSSFGVTDNSHLNEFSDDIKIICTPCLDPTARFIKIPKATNGNGQGTGKQPATSRLSLNKIARSIAKVAWLGFDKNVLIPDPIILWYPHAIAAGMEELQRQPYDLIYATGEPYSAFLIARALSRKSGIPYVLDMRDPWTLETYRSQRNSFWRQKVERNQERRTLADCRACVFANRASEVYAKTFPQWADKFHYIPNGYDSADFEDVEVERFDKFTIVHTGTFLPGYRTADVFLRALNQLLTMQPELREKVQVWFVGKIGDEQKLIAELGLEDVVKQTAYVPHRRSIAYLKGADLLLLVGGKRDWEETGKIYEYFAAGKPILGLVKRQGAAASLLQQYAAAHIVDKDDISETCNALGDLISGSERLNVPVDRAWVRQFERQQLTGKLAQVFNQVVNEAHLPSPV